MASRISRGGPLTFVERMRLKKSAETAEGNKHEEPKFTGNMKSTRDWHTFVPSNNTEADATAGQGDGKDSGGMDIVVPETKKEAFNWVSERLNLHKPQNH